MAETSHELRVWREQFRSAEIGPRYSGWLHLACTTSGSTAVIVLAASRLLQVRPIEWLLLPAFLLLSNLGEYLGHRIPMHHRRRGIGPVFKRHTLQHHRFFVTNAMECESPRDFKIVLFPPVMLLFFVGGMAVPIAILFHLVVSANAGYLFIIVAVGHFLGYEWLHFIFHLPMGHPAARLPLVAQLRRHHEVHHDPTLMTRWNFNLTLPIADWLLHTRYRSDHPSYRITKGQTDGGT